jgi:hypothetical protein
MEKFRERAVRQSAIICNDMADNRPPRRPGHLRSGEPFPDPRERAIRARQAAEALFAPKPRIVETSISSAGPAAERLAPAPRAAETSRTARVHHETVAPPASPDPANEIPASQLARIRTWVKYGMTVAQVAEVYGVPVAEIERLLRKA